MFVGVEREIDSWLDMLPDARVGYASVSAAVACLDDAVCAIAQDPYVHSDRVAEVVAAVLKAKAVRHVQRDVVLVEWCSLKGLNGQVIVIGDVSDVVRGTYALEMCLNGFVVGLHLGGTLCPLERNLF